MAAGIPFRFRVDSPHMFHRSSVVVALSFLLGGGCLALSPDEMRALERIEQAGYSLDHPPAGFVPAASDRKAAYLNALPGIGNFYLAANGGGGLQWLLGTGNLLLWPISPAWSICEGYVDANTMNKRALAAYCDEHPNLCREPRIQDAPPAAGTNPSAKPPYKVDGWEYDPVTLKGRIRLRVMGDMPASETKRWARENIAAIILDKNIVIEAGKAPPKGAKFQSLGENFTDGVLTVEFEAVE